MAIPGEGGDQEGDERYGTLEERKERGRERNHDVVCGIRLTDLAEVKILENQLEELTRGKGKAASA
jgi:hypothetical protein